MYQTLRGFDDVLMLINLTSRFFDDNNYIHYCLFFLISIIWKDSENDLTSSF